MFGVQTWDIKRLQFIDNISSQENLDRRAASAAMWGQMDGNFGNKVMEPSKKVNVFDLM